MKKNDYLKRINHVGEFKPSLNTLRALQEAHLLSVPFENLDIHNRKRIVLEIPRLYQKIVTMKRGGFCYELNGLFHWLLQEVGFNVKLLMGRVYDSNRDSYGPEFDHMLILADVDSKQWLADVGFGDFSMHPLPFALNQPLNDTNGTFIIEQHDDVYYKVSRFYEKESRYLPEYIFSLKERQLKDFETTCLYHQTSPDSHFTQKKVCSIATLNGRITLTDDKLIITNNGTREESTINGEQEFHCILQKYFNITLS